MTEEGIIYGLIGTSLSHSFSMDFFNQKFISEGIDAQYFNFELNDIGELMTIFSEYPNLDGLNVTMPYKEKVIPFMDQLDETAEMVGAVNVIKILKGTSAGVIKLVGYNTDFLGFKNSIEPLLTSEMNKALVLGTGGSSKAVKAGLESLGLTVDFVSRRKTATTITYEELTKQMINAHKVIVNTTPLGTYPNTDVCPDIPYRFLTSSHLCYDLVYNPSETMFMKNSAAAGAVVKNGLEMLLLQAFESYRIWTEG
ncbi:MAG: shikimate dehydrogenase [Muribaculaceae bacterium]|nr:shikimate dehydrogenase [Muribaculaceae bacterium]